MTTRRGMATSDPARLRRAMERLQELVRRASAHRGRLVAGDRFGGSRRRSVTDGGEPLAIEGLAPGSRDRPGMSLRRNCDGSRSDTTLKDCIVKTPPTK